MKKYQMTVYVNKNGHGPMLILETKMEFKVDIEEVRQLNWQSLDDAQLMVKLGSDDLDELRRAVDYVNKNC